MNSFELNKIAAGVLIALLVGMIANLISKAIINPTPLSENVLQVVVENSGSTPEAAAPKTAEPIQDLLASANIQNGEKLAKRNCLQCHSFEAGASHKIGPNLWAIANSQIAQHPNFSYSSAFKAKDLKWTAENLNHYLFKPRDFIPGTKMSFIGLEKTQDRADVIAYLQTLQ